MKRTIPIVLLFLLAAPAAFAQKKQLTLDIVDELEKVGKPFDMRIYPRSRHGVVEPPLALDLQRTILQFMKQNLLP